MDFCSCQAVSLISVAGGGYALYESFCSYGVKVAPTAVGLRTQARGCAKRLVGGSEKQSQGSLRSARRSRNQALLPSSTSRNGSAAPGRLRIFEFLALFGCIWCSVSVNASPDPRRPRVLPRLDSRAARHPRQRPILAWPAADIQLDIIYALVFVHELRTLLHPAM